MEKYTRRYIPKTGDIKPNCYGNSWENNWGGAITCFLLYTHIRFYIRNIPFSNVYINVYTNPSVVVGSKIIFLAVKEQ